MLHVCVSGDQDHLLLIWLCRSPILAPVADPFVGSSPCMPHICLPYAAEIPTLFHTKFVCVKDWRPAATGSSRHSTYDLTGARVLFTGKHGKDYQGAVAERVCRQLLTNMWLLGAGSQKGAQQEDAGSVGHDSLLSRITITAPDDNHVVISMPAGNTTKPASHVARSSANSSSADNRADPSDSAYSADALPPPNMGQSHSGGTHEVCLEQWQRQRQPGSQQSTSQSGQDPLQHNRPDLAQQHAGPGDQTAGPGAASNMSSDVHRQQVRSNQTAGGSLESLVPEPLSLHSPQSQNMLQHRNEPHQRQQQQPAPLSRSSADVQLPDQRPPKGESAPDALSAVSVHGTGLHSGPVALSKSQSAHQGPAESLAGVSAPSDQVNSGGGPRLSGGVCCRDQQLDALHEQLQSLVQSSQNINDSLLRVHDQIQFLKSQ